MARIVSVSMTPPFLLFLSERLSRLLKKGFSCFDRLSTNGKSPTTSSLPPFALSLSKGERRVFQHPVKSCLSGMLGLCLLGLLDDLLYQVMRYFFVVRKLHVERAATAGHRAQIRRVG